MHAIAKLTYLDIWRDPRTLVDENKVHLDMQGKTGDGRRNLQVQLKRNTKSIAAALVHPDPLIESEQRYIIRKVRNSLYESLSTGKIYSVKSNAN